MPRWTVRNVSPETINAVQSLCIETGASLGEALNACIRAGLEGARGHLRRGIHDVTTDDLSRDFRALFGQVAPIE
jgi:hypothetical protein